MPLKAGAKCTASICDSKTPSGSVLSLKLSEQEQRNGGANILVQNAEIRSQSSTFKRDEKQYAAAM